MFRTNISFNSKLRSNIAAQPSHNQPLPDSGSFSRKQSKNILILLPMPGIILALNLCIWIRQKVQEDTTGWHWLKAAPVQHCPHTLPSHESSVSISCLHSGLSSSSPQSGTGRLCSQVRPKSMPASQNQHGGHSQLKMLPLRNRWFRSCFDEE